MGWDSFGLPAEQYAIRTGTHPAVTTQANIDTYRRQLESLGFSYDWDREVATSDPNYYKWTQWIFTKLFEKGLAYEAEINVNFCPASAPFSPTKKWKMANPKKGAIPSNAALKQWIFRITAYADRLLADLDLLDWPDHLKKPQTNWIGRSEGAMIDFSRRVHTAKPIPSSRLVPTLFLAPPIWSSRRNTRLSIESPLTSKDARRRSISQKTAAKNDLERTDLAKEKTGVWTGAYALHPVTGKKIPIWIADYVFMGYGTGAVMAVPAHDERDFEFAASIQDCPIVPVHEAAKDKTVSWSDVWQDGTVIHGPRRSESACTSGQREDDRLARRAPKGKGPSITSCATGSFPVSATGASRCRFSILPTAPCALLELDELPLDSARARRLQARRKRGEPTRQGAQVGRDHRSKNGQKSPPRNQHHAAVGRLLLVLFALLRSPQRQRGMEFSRRKNTGCP